MAKKEIDEPVVDTDIQKEKKIRKLKETKNSKGEETSETEQTEETSETVSDDTKTPSEETKVEEPEITPEVTPQTTTPPPSDKFIEISPAAEKWRKWLALHGSTPERFLEKYPNHPAKKLVEELIKK